MTLMWFRCHIPHLTPTQFNGTLRHECDSLITLSSKFSDQSAHLKDDSEPDSSFEDRIRYRKWRFGWVVDAFRSKEHCSNSNSDCPKGRCPEGRRCRGLCGPERTCWWFVCQDCCRNIGCYKHDRICIPNGKHSIECLASSPIGFVCS